MNEHFFRQQDEKEEEKNRYQRQERKILRAMSL